MAKTNKQLQAEIDKHIIEINNLTDTVEILEKGTRQIAKILGLDGIAETTYFNDADIETIEKAIEKLQGKYEKCFEELSMKCGECEGLVKANETIVKAHKELELDKKDLHKRLIEGLQINIEKVEKIGELENKVDEQFKVITKYEKELEEQDKEIEELKEENHDLDTMVINMKEKIKELEEQKKDDWRLERYNKLQERTKELYELTKTSNINRTEKYYKQSQEVIKLQQEELKTQIIQKNTYKKENKRLKKRRREGRYNIDKFITNLTKGAYIYVEGASRPTKLHKRLTDAIAEKQRLEDKTGKKVYILTNL